MQIQKCKGCRDLLPGDMAKFRGAESAFREACLRAGYTEVRTPTLEYLHLFTSAGTLTSGMLRRVYSFLDWDGWSGERVVLKPDATIPVVRLYLESLHGEGPARLFYVTNTFVFEESGAKSRERWQCGAELIGVGSPLADADLVSLSLDVLRKLGIQDVSLNLSHAGLIRAALSGLGISLEAQRELFDRILDRGEEALAGIAAAVPQTLEAMKLLFTTRGESSGYLKNLRALTPAGPTAFQSALDDFIRTFELIETLGVSCRVDMTAGKGFEYYTGLIFRINAGEENIGGGGRYDRLVSVMGGQDTPAAGFALYMNKLMSLIAENRAAGRTISVICQPDSYKPAVQLAAVLRDAGHTAAVALKAVPSAGCRVEVGPAGQYIVEDNAGRVVCTGIPAVMKKLGRA
jgi:histidyl-tRNA synthetase